MKRVALWVFAVLLFGVLSFAQGSSVTGVVSDSHCGAKHAEASAQSQHCVEHCVSGGAKYVLLSEGKVYQLDAQDKFKGLGGKSVTVTGTVNGDSIAVDSVAEAKSN